ncbi:MAG: hypothetical protein ABI776_11100 [Nocardioidaceae bacterium]
MSRRTAGRVLVAAYTVLAIAAVARSVTQIATRFAEAPLAYVLSAGAGVVYLVAAIALRRPDDVARRVAAVSMSVELAGVLAVGTMTVVSPGSFPDQTVWSSYGAGYAFVPLVLPVLGLMWLRGRAPSRPCEG